MLNNINAIVQALVWTTLAGLMYATWLHSRATARGESFDLSHHWQPVLHQLQAMWALLALGLIISILVFSIPTLFDNARSAPSTCAPSTSSAPALTVDDSPTLLACAPRDSTSP